MSKSKSKNFLWWALLNGTFAALMWMTFVEGMSGAGRLVVLFAWISVAMVVLGLVLDLRPIRAIPSWIAGLVSVAFVGVLVWHGWWVTGIAYGVAASLAAAIRAGAK